MISGMDDAPLDEAVLDELRQALSVGAFAELSGTFLEQLRMIADRFAAATAAGDHRAAEHAAHELAGVAGTMGAVALASAAREALLRCRTPCADLEATATALSSSATTASVAFADYVRRIGSRGG